MAPDETAPLLAALEALGEVGRLLLDSTDVDRVARQIVESAQDLLAAQHAALYRLDADTGDLVHVALAGDAGPAGQAPVVMPRGTGLVGVAARERRPVATRDVLADPRVTLLASYRARVEQAPYRAALAVPLLVRDRLVGVCSVGDAAGRVFADREVALLQAFGDQAALALANADAFAEIARQRRESEVVAELARTLGASLDLDVVLRRVVEGAREVCQSDGAAIALREPDSAAVRLRYFAGFDIGPLLVEPGRGIGGQVLLTGRPVRTSRYLADPEVPRPYVVEAQSAAVQAVLAVPITGLDRLEGVLYVISRRPRGFADQDEAALLRVADHAAIAIRNARLFAAEQAARSDAERATARLRELVQDLGAVVWEARLRPDGERWAESSPREFSFVSVQAEALLGYPVGRWLREPDFWPSLVYPQDREATVAACRAAAARERDYALEYRAMTVTGGVVWLRDIVHVVRDAEGHSTRLRGLMVDVTDRKRAEERRALQLGVTALLADAVTLEQAVRDLLAAVGERLGWDLGEMWLVDRAASCLRWGGLWHAASVDLAEFEAASREMVFAPGAGLPGRAWLAGHPEWIPNVAEDADFLRVALAARAGLHAAFAFPVRTDGQVVAVVVFFAREVRPPDEELLKMLNEVGAQVGQFAERRRTADALRKLSNAVEQAADALLITDRDGRIEYVNPSFERMTGYARQEALGQTPRLLKGGQQPASFYADLWARLLAGEVVRTVFVNRKKDGAVYEEEKTISPLRDARGAITHFVATGRDVTEQRRLEARLAQAQKMDTVGRLAGGIAHDFNNLLTVMLGHAEILLADLDPNDPRRADTEEIRTAAGRAATLTQQLLAFSRRQVLSPRVVDLRAAVDGMQTLLRRLLGEDVELVIRAEGEPGRIRVDPGQLEQVLLNLAVNARDAMPRGGRLTLTTATHVVGAVGPPPAPGVLPGRHARLVVSDTGAGMDPETLAHAFEPFFTTKAVGAGTGLGLATVHGIVEQHHGHVWVESAPGEGTTFTILFPATDEPVEAAPPRPAPRARLRVVETILLVEDEEPVRDLAREVLRAEGYRVLAAADGRVALRIAEQHVEPIQLLVTDVVMPEMSGVEVAERLSARHPEARVLYVSGYPDDALLRHRALGPGIELLEKPFTPEVLARKVREILDRPPGPPRPAP